MPVRKRFGSVVARFTDDGTSAPLANDSLCAFELSTRSQKILLTRLVASWADVSNLGFCGTSRVLVFIGPEGVNLGSLAREPLTLDLESKYSIHVLMDIIGVSGQYEIDLTGDPIVADIGLHLYAVHLPPFGEADSHYISSVMALSIFGHYLSPSESEEIYPGIHGR